MFQRNEMNFREVDGAITLHDVPQHSTIFGQKNPVTLINCGDDVIVHSKGLPNVQGTIGVNVICYIHEDGEAKFSGARRMRLNQDGTFVEEPYSGLVRESFLNQVRNRMRREVRVDIGSLQDQQNAISKPSDIGLQNILNINQLRQQPKNQNEKDVVVG